MNENLAIKITLSSKIVQGRILNMINLPLIPNVGPCDGCLMQAMVFSLLCIQSACAKPIVVVLLPSPLDVGVTLQKK